LPPRLPRSGFVASAARFRLLSCDPCSASATGFLLSSQSSLSSACVPHGWPPLFHDEKIVVGCSLGGQAFYSAEATPRPLQRTLVKTQHRSYRIHRSISHSAARTQHLRFAMPGPPLTFLTTKSRLGGTALGFQSFLSKLFSLYSGRAAGRRTTTPDAYAKSSVSSMRRDAKQ
jgi:hypothetical protein